MLSKNSGQVAKSTDPDQGLHSAASPVDLYYLLRHVCPNFLGIYGTITNKAVERDNQNLKTMHKMEHKPNKYLCNNCITSNAFNI